MRIAFSRWGIIVALSLVCAMGGMAPALAQDEGGDPVIKTLAQLGDTSATVRQQAIEQLRGSTGDVRIVAPLIAALKDREPGVRKLAADILGETHDPKAVVPLVQLLQDADPEVCGKAVESLGIIGDPRVVDILIGMLQREQPLKLKAIEALWRISDPRAVTPLLTLLHDKEPQLAGAAADALGYLGDGRAVEPLLAIAKDENSAIRERAISALGYLREPKALDLVTTLVNSKDQTLRSYAIDALGRLGDPRGVDPLLAQLKDPDFQVRIQVVQALGSLRDARAVEPLSQLLQGKGDESQLRMYTAEALGNIRDARAVPALVAVLNAKGDEFTNPAVPALGALAKIGGKGAVDALLPLVKSLDQSQCTAAIRALGVAGDPKAIDALTAALGSKDDLVRGEAIIALAKIPDQRALQQVAAAATDAELPALAESTALVSALTNNPKVTPEIFLALVQQRKNPEIIADVVSVIGKKQIKDPRLLAPLAGWISSTSFILTDEIVQALTPYGQELIDALLAALKNPDTPQKEMALQVLGKIGNAQTADALLPFLNEPTLDHGTLFETLGNLKATGAFQTLLVAANNPQDASARLGAITGLGAMQDPRAIGTLLAALGEQQGDFAPATRAVAATALGKIGDAQAVPALITAVADESEDVRTAAATALAQFPPDQHAETPLLAMLFDTRNGEGWDRQAAATALARSANENLLPSLTLAVEREPKVLMSFLTEHKTARATLMLARCLHEEQDSAVRAQAAEILGKRKDPAATIHLIYALKDDDDAVRAAAQVALKAITGQDLGAEHGKWVEWWMGQKK